ncbi:MAG: DUF4142 domain-containing protein [Acidobacteriaceae bacterium]|jgi:predicted outer membrane protein
MKRHNFRLLSIRSLAAGLLLLTLAPAAMAQMQAPMGATSPGNMNGNNPNMMPNNNPNMPAYGTQPGGITGSQNGAQMLEQSMFGNLRRNFDVENDLSKMALKNSSNDDVKKFAHQVLSENLGLSNDLNVPGPNGDRLMQPDTVPEPTKKAEKQMKKMTGKPFDQMYLVQMDAYVKNDQEVVQKAEETSNVPNVSELGMRVRSLSDDRQKQIGTLTQETGFTIQ